MTPERWRVVKRVVQDALERAPAERSTCLDAACADDPGLRAEVESLLAAAEAPFGMHTSADFLDRPTPFARALDDGRGDEFGTAPGTSTDSVARLAAALADRFALDHEVGRGGMAVVYRARDVRHDRPVAIKVLRPELTAAVDRARMLREIRLTARLQHPHIVPVLDSGEANGTLWFAMPYVEGTSLRARLREGPMPLGEALAILRDVAGALAYAHAHGVVHRDIKPENVLLSSGTAVVTDFGIAKALRASRTHGPHGATGDTEGTLTRVGTSLGTPAYMAPEQVVGAEPVDARADVYAWGVLAYELLAGRHPFAGKATVPQLLAAHLGETPTPLGACAPSLPRPLVDLVTHSLAKDPAARFASARAVVEALEAMTAPRDGSSDGSRTRSRVVWLAALTLAGVLGAGGLIAPGARRFVGLGGAPAASATVRPRVVVAPFENLTGDPSLAHVGRMAADWVTRGLAQADSLEVVSSATVTMAVGGAAGSYAEVVKRLATTTGATTLVTGSVVRRGDSLLVQAQLADPRTGRLLGTTDPAGAPGGDPMPALDAVRERVLGALAVSGRRDNLTTYGTHAPSYPAYREYLEGVERFMRFQDYRGAAARLERAATLDPAFAPALQLLLVSHYNLGHFAAADSVLRRVDAMRDRLGTQERAVLELQRAMLAGDWDETVRWAQAAAARDSTAWLALDVVGAFSTARLRPDVALPALLAADSGLSAAGYAMNRWWQAEAYHEAGHYAEELAVIARARRRYPADRRFVPRGLRALAALHRPAAALALADTVLADRALADPVPAAAGDLTGPTLDAVLTGAAEFRAHGDSATARRLAEALLAWHAGHPEPALTPGRARQVGAAWVEAGRPDSAERYLRVAARAGACCAVAELAAARFARTDGGPAARTTLLRVADSLGASRRPWEYGRSRFAAAGLVARVDRERAMELLRQGVREGYRMASLHYAPLLAPLRGYPPFEALVTPRR